MSRPSNLRVLLGVPGADANAVAHLEREGLTVLSVPRTALDLKLSDPTPHLSPAHRCHGIRVWQRRDGHFKPALDPEGGRPAPET